MRFLAMLGAICALSQAAMAETPQCRTISEPRARLACYDKAAEAGGAAVAPAVAATRPAMRPAAVQPLEPERYVDTISAEDAKMNAQLRNICRGC